MVVEGVQLNGGRWCTGWWFWLAKSVVSERSDAACKVVPAPTSRRRGGAGWGAVVRGTSPVPLKSFRPIGNQAFFPSHSMPPSSSYDFPIEPRFRSHRENPQRLEEKTNSPPRERKHAPAHTANVCATSTLWLRLRHSDDIYRLRVEKEHRKPNEHVDIVHAEKMSIAACLGRYHCPGKEKEKEGKTQGRKKEDRL